MEKLNLQVEIKKKASSAILALLLSFATVCMTRVHFEGDIWGTVNVNYVSEFGISAILLGLFLFLIYLFLICFCEKYIKRFFEKTACSEKIEGEHPGKIILFWAVIIFLAWLPYYLSYYPGGVYSDTFASISYAMSGVLTNRHPFCYTALIWIFIKIGRLFGRSLTWSIGLFTAIQMLALECEFLYCIFWMLRHQINRGIRIIITLFWTFFPLIPLYAISVWKDTPFCMAVLFWMLFIVDLYLELCSGKYTAKTIAGFLAGGILVAFTRNNGSYIVALFVFLLVFVLWKKMRTDKHSRIVMLCSLLMLGGIFVIQGPGYKMLGIEKTETVENFGIPLQQIGAVVACDGDISEEQKECINHFIPYENVREHYSPMLADNLKWYGGLDGYYLSRHTGEFLRLWFQLLKQNPSIYVKSYMIATSGFWNIDIATGDAYVQVDVWNNEIGVVQKDYFSDWFGFSFRHFTDPRYYISSAWFFWIFLIAAWYIVQHYGWKSILLFLPQLGIWLTLMVATPIAVSLRYIAAAMFTLPFVILVPLLLERIQREQDFNEKQEI